MTILKKNNKDIVPSNSCTPSVPFYITFKVLLNIYILNMEK